MDSLQCKTNPGQINQNAGFWNVLPEFPAVQDSPSMCHNIQTTQDLTDDLKTGYLPQVSFVTPNNTVSDHFPYANIVRGQEYIAQMINAIVSNQALYMHTAIFLTWDDYGGFYDNVLPKQVDQAGYGFRVLMILISPYAINGISYGNGKEEDFTAFLSTIESNWNLKALNPVRDGTNSPLWYLFNFNQVPIPPLVVPNNMLPTYPLSTCSVCHFAFAPAQTLPIPQSWQPDTNATYPTNMTGDGGAYD
jgi:Phosphoesterase family